MLQRQRLITLGAPAEPAQHRPLAQGRPRLILQELARDNAEVTFTGLRRRLGIHPQALTRELRRLEEEQLVERAAGSYRLTQDGEARVSQAEPQSAAELLEVLRLLLPPGADAETVARALAGRWFNNLRWYGRADGPGELVLLWLTEDQGSLVRLRLVAGTLVIEAESGASEPGIAPLLAAVARAL